MTVTLRYKDRQQMILQDHKSLFSDIIVLHIMAMGNNNNKDKKIKKNKDNTNKNKDSNNQKKVNNNLNNTNNPITPLKTISL